MSGIKSGILSELEARVNYTQYTGKQTTSHLKLLTELEGNEVRMNEGFENAALRIHDEDRGGGGWRWQVAADRPSANASAKANLSAGA